MATKTYGYVRVSTQEQNETRQLTAMREFGVDEENIIVEKLSGKDFQRQNGKRQSWCWICPCLTHAKDET